MLVIMKSWRGKGPVSSRTHVKRIPVYTPSKPQRQKQKEKDPVEVRTLKFCGRCKAP